VVKNIRAVQRQVKVTILLRWIGSLGTILVDLQRSDFQLQTRSGNKPDSGEVVWTDETYRIFEYDRAEKPSLNMFPRTHPQEVC
jgi:hypothetical protein